MEIDDVNAGNMDDFLREKRKEGIKSIAFDIDRWDDLIRYTKANYFEIPYNVEEFKLLGINLHLK